MFNKSRKSCRLCDNVEKYGTSRQATDGNMIRRMPLTGRLINTRCRYEIVTELNLELRIFVERRNSKCVPKI